MISRQLILRPTIRQYEQILACKGQLSAPVDEAFDKAYSFLNEMKSNYPLLPYTECRYKGVAYIAGPLTGVSEELKERYTESSDILGRHGIFGYVPHLYGTDPKKHPNVLPEEVRNIDFLWAVVLADFHVNWLDPLAHGNAIEEGWGEAYRIPTVYAYPLEMKLSRLVKGMDNVVHRIEYASIESALKSVDAYGLSIENFLKYNSHQFADISDFFKEDYGGRHEVPLSEILLMDTQSRQVGALEAVDREFGTYFARFGKELREYYDGSIYDGRHAKGNTNFLLIHQAI